MSKIPGDLERNVTSLLVLWEKYQWEKVLTLALRHRHVRRGAADEVGSRFICRDENGIHACTVEEIDANRPLDLCDLVPINRTTELSDLLTRSSTENGVFSDEGWKLLTAEVATRGASGEQLAQLSRHRKTSAAGAFFVAIEMLLDLKKLPPLQWRNGVDEHGSPRY